MNTNISLSSSASESADSIKCQGAPSDEQMQLMIAEYSALRDEILKRSEIRYQIISFTLLIAGTLITFGLQPSSPSYVLFVFPMLGCFLASLWSHNRSWTMRISAYIRENIEREFQRSGWESAAAEEPHSGSLLARTAFSVRGIFLSTEIIALLLGLLKSTGFTTIDVALIVIDAISIMVTFMVLRHA